jgi:hypothetical protein
MAGGSSRSDLPESFATMTRDKAGAAVREEDDEAVRETGCDRDRRPSFPRRSRIVMN